VQFIQALDADSIPSSSALTVNSPKTSPNFPPAEVNSCNYILFLLVACISDFEFKYHIAIADGIYNNPKIVIVQPTYFFLLPCPSIQSQKLSLDNSVETPIFIQPEDKVNYFIMALTILY